MRPDQRRQLGAVAIGWIKTHYIYKMSLFFHNMNYCFVQTLLSVIAISLDANHDDKF